MAEGCFISSGEELGNTAPCDPNYNHEKNDLGYSIYC